MNEGFQFLHSPSPRPSPARRGRIVRRFLECRESAAVRRSLVKIESAERCSLSHRMGEGQGEGSLVFSSFPSFP